MTHTTICQVWQIEQVVQEQIGTTSRVSIELENHPLWFESDDAVLEPSIEAFAGVFLLPCLHYGVKLRLSEPVDTQWLENVRRLYEIYCAWWGYEAGFPIEPVAQVRHQPAASAIGLCFTGGVDSFYSLLHCPKPAERLVFAHGYDIPLDDLPRIQAYEKSLREVASNTGKSAILVRTNLRSHPLFRQVSWNRTHGGALAALGLLLSKEIGGLIIPPSYASWRLRPWGSHPETDPLFSSSRCQIIHHSTPDGRPERIHAIAAHPLVQNHLRVCNANQSLTGNCSSCEKCVMTMTVLEGAEQLQHFQTFDRGLSLEARLNQLDHISPHLIELWQELAGNTKNAKVRRAIDRVLTKRTWKLAARFKRLPGKLKRFFAKRLSV